MTFQLKFFHLAIKEGIKLEDGHALLTSRIANNDLANVAALVEL